MKDINIRVSTKLSIIVGAIILLIFAGLIAFAYKEMSTMRRDLYAVRGDYYGSYNPGEIGSTEYSPVSIEVLGQEVKDLRIADNTATYDSKIVEADPFYNFKKQPVRVVKVKATNNESYILSLSSYNFGYINQNGQVVRAVEVHPDDELNEHIVIGYGNEIAQGGTTELYIYFANADQEVTDLIYLP